MSKNAKKGTRKRSVKLSVVGAGPGIMANHPHGTMAQEAERIEGLMTGDEASQLAWLHMVLDPWAGATRMPLLLGNGVWEEDLYRYDMYGTVAANPSGYAFGLVCQDDWHAGSPGNQFIGYTSVGAPLLCTDAGYLATTAPVNGTGSATGVTMSALSSSTSYGGAAPTGDTRYVQTACAVRCRPITKADDLAGEVMLVFTKDTANYPITGVSYDTVRAYPADVVIRKIAMLANWVNDTWIELPAVPLERQAFDSVKPVSAGVVVSNHPTLGIFAKGMTAGEALATELVAIYQFEITGSQRVQDDLQSAPGGLYGSRPGYSVSHAVENTNSATNGALTYPGYTYSDGGYHANSVRGMMTHETARELTHRSAGRLSGRVVRSAHMGVPHVNNPRSINAAASLIETNPSLLGRVKQLPRKAWKYFKENWASLLQKAIPLVLGLL